jgi:hypothetical protein
MKQVLKKSYIWWKQYRGFQRSWAAILLNWSSSGD